MEILPPKFDELWDYGKPSDTEVVFRQILTDYQESADEAYVVELQTQIARCLSLQRRFDEAHLLLDEIERLPTVASGRVRMRYLLERGRTLNSSRNKPAALPLFIEAWEIGRECGEDGLAVDAAHMVAIAEEPGAALEWNERALKLAESSPMPAARKWRKSLHNNLGWTYFGIQRYDLALGHFIRCREAAAELGDAESERIASWSIAKTYRLQGRIQEALEIQQSQLAELAAQGTEGPYVQEEMAECLYAMGRVQEATPYFATAFELLSQDPWLMDNEPDRIERLKVLGTS